MPRKSAGLLLYRRAASWPPRSGRRRELPEVDRAAWFPLVARRKILQGQRPSLEQLERALDGHSRRE